MRFYWLFFQARIGQRLMLNRHVFLGWI